MLALEILNKYRNLCSGIYLGDDYSDGVDSYSKDIEECDEAIKELEALENRSCDSCKTKNCSVRRILVEKDEINTDYFNCNDWESKC